MLNKPHLILIKALFAGALIFILSDCQNDMRQVNALGDLNDSAQISGVDVEITRSIRGKQAIRMKGKVVRQLSVTNNTFEFPNGIEMYSYDTSGAVTSHMSADYSVYNDKEGSWEAKNNVVVNNDKGDCLNTEYLVWSREKGTIETNQFVKITTADGVIYGDGMVSDENFNNWEVKNGRGIFDIENE